MTTQQALPAYMQFRYSFFDGTNHLAAVPIRGTTGSQTIDMLVFNRDGTISKVSNVRHQSSGDATYWAEAGLIGDNIFKLTP